MHIPRIDHLILGYREISFSEDDIACVVDILLKNGLEISIKHGVARLSVSKYKELERVLSGNVSYKVTEVRGFYGLLLRFLRHPAALAVSVFFLLFFLFSSGVVWDVA